MVTRREQFQPRLSATLLAATSRALLGGIISALPLSPIAHAQGTPPPELIGGEEGSLEEQAEAPQSGTEINIKNAEIASVIKIFSRKTKRNYILDDKVKGKVSIFLPSKVTPDEALRILESVLSYKGFTSVPIGENLWKIVLAREAKQTTIPTVLSESAEPASAAVVTRLLSLKYIDAEALKGILAPLVSGEGLINAYSPTNSLILIDSEDNLRRIEGIVKSMDVPSSNRDMTILPIKHADAKEIAERLNEILGLGSKGSSSSSDDPSLDSSLPGVRSSSAGVVPPPQPPRDPSSAAAAGVQAVSTGALATGGAATTPKTRTKEPKIIADERTNSLIIIADEDTTNRIRALVEQLDSKVDLSDSKFYVYRCQHAKADELAQVLSSLGGGAGGSGSGGRARAGSSAFGDDMGGGLGDSGGNRGNRSGANSQRRSSSSQNRLSRQSRSPGQSRMNQQSGFSGSVELGEDILIAADPATNSLIIRASRADYEKIKNLLEKIDLKRRQVLVEAMIMEVSVGDEEKLGASFMGSTGIGKNNGDGGLAIKGDYGGDLSSFFQNPAALTDFSIAAASSGTLTLPGGIKVPTQSVLVNMLKRNSSVNILSSPNILTTDNEQAEIVVGENVPFISSTAANNVNLNNTFNQVDRQDVGITLRLTPQISSNDTVTMNIFTEVSAVTGSDPQLGPTTSVRTSETTVISKDSQMIVIGGLLADQVRKGERGIPFLKDIPVLGWLFKVRTESVEKRNLLILITPRVIKDQFDMRENSLERKDKFGHVLENLGEGGTRDEVLQSPNFDKVSEVEAFTGTKPSTIRPPAAASPSVAATPLRSSAAPVIPQFSQVEERGRFIVLKGTPPKGSRLERHCKAGHCFIELPEGSTPEILEFFQNKAQPLYYGGATAKSQLLVRGVFDSTKGISAVKGLAGVSSIPPYRPAPDELMSLGSGLWSKK